MNINRLNWTHLDFGNINETVREKITNWLRERQVSRPEFFLAKYNYIVLSSEQANALITYLRETWEVNVDVRNV